jgi:hypothetical protein
MAKKSSGVNKSKAIREYYEANPRAKPMEVSEALKKKGITVSPGFVSTIRSTSKSKKGKKKSTRARASKVTPRSRPAAGATSKADVSIESLVKLKSVVSELGGIDKTRNVLDGLETLMK